MSESKTLPVLRYDRFFRYDELRRFVEALAGARPDLCRLDSFGTSREGRAIFLLTITDFTSGSPDDRPACLVHACIHAVELAGIHAALHAARQLLIDDDESDLLRNFTFYIIPCLNPDGSEFAAATSTRVRSRIDWTQREANTVYQEDLNGDGLILSMRQEHPDGDWVADDLEPRILIKRRDDSAGPCYRVLPEGRIHDWDGGDRIKAAGLQAWLGTDPAVTGGLSYDWNRNFPYAWQPPSEQQGSGEAPLSEPETRQLARFMRSHRNLMVLLGMHTGHASIVQPPASGPRAPIDPADDRLMDELAAMGTAETGFPALPLVKMHPAFREDQYRGGHLLDFAYQHLGMCGFDFEMGTILNSAGLQTSQFLAAQSVEELEAHDRCLFQWWDRQSARPPLFQPWEPFDHPQLGRVEIGGFLYTHLDNPALADVEEISDGAYRFMLRLAGQRPRLVAEDLQVECAGPSTYRIRLRLMNPGGLATSITHRSRSLHPRLEIELRPAPGITLVSTQDDAEGQHLDALGGTRNLCWAVSGEAKDANLCDIDVQGHAAGRLRLAVTTRGGDEK